MVIFSCGCNHHDIVTLLQGTSQHLGCVSDPPSFRPAGGVLFTDQGRSKSFLFVEGHSTNQEDN